MIIDTLFIVAIFLGLYRGVTGSLFKNLINYSKIFTGIILAMKFSYKASHTVETSLTVQAGYVPFLSFILMFFLIMLFFTVMNFGFKRYAAQGNYNFINRGFAVLLWIFMVATTISGMTFYGVQSDVFSPTMLAQSSIYPYVDWIYPSLQCHLSYVLPAFQGIFDALQEMFGGLAHVAKGQC